MRRLRVYGAIFVILLSIISITVGTLFIAQGFTTKQSIFDGLRAEKVTLGIEDSALNIGAIVDTTEEAEAAAATITQHLRESYGSYADTTRGSEERATYLDGLTLVNSLNQAVIGFSVTTLIIVSGVMLIVMGLTTGTVGIAHVELVD